MTRGSAASSHGQDVCPPGQASAAISAVSRLNGYRGPPRRPHQN